MAMEGWRFRAANFFFLIIVFGLQLFNAPCSKGSCSSPIEVVADFLYAKNLANNNVVKSLLYPKAFLANAESIIADSGGGFSLPNWNNLLADYKRKPNLDENISQLIFVTGCVTCLIGATLSAFGVTFLSPAGTIAILWYVYTAGKSNPNINLHPMFTLAIICSIATINFDFSFKVNLQTTSETKQD